MKRHSLIVSLVFAAACHDAVMPGPMTPPNPPVGPTRPASVMEITLSGIGTPDMSANAVGLPAPSVPYAPHFTLTVPKNGDGSGDGTIQLQAVSTGSFTSGTRGSGGVRYFWATFNVRNATSSGTAYNTARTNLTFVAMNTGIGQSAISTMLKFDGSAATSSIATTIVPSGNVYQQNGSVFVNQPDVMQAFTEGDVAAMPVTGGLAYGFVVRNGTGRTLPASPGASQFDGTVTFAFKYPLQATASADPYTISAQFQAIDDSQTRITQSIEEQGAGQTTFQTRATAIGATQVTLLSGGAYSGAISARHICSLRTAGTVAAPVASLATTTPAFQSFTPNAFAGAAMSVPTSTSFSANFDCSSNATPTSQNLVVTGSVRGRYFLTGTYTGFGTQTLSTPTGTFFAGEEVEVSATTGLGANSLPFVARYRVATSASSGTFGTASVAATIAGGTRIAVGDLNRDGTPDIVVVDNPGGRIGVLLGNGNGTFGSVTYFAVGSAPNGLVLTDLNGDGKLDAVVMNSGEVFVSVLLGNGNGTFATQTTVGITLSGNAQPVAGDINGDGRADVVVPLQGASYIKLIGNGDGTLGGGTPSSFAGAANVFAIALGDPAHTGLLHLFAVGIGAPNGLYGESSSYGGGSLRALTLGDVNGDGYTDAVAASSGGIRVFLNSAGTLPITGTTVGTGSLTAITVGDVNGDGKLDVVTTLAGAIRVFAGNGDGTFGAAVDYAISGTPDAGGLVLVDVNGDGRLDVVTINPSTGEIDVLLGQP